MGTDAVNLPRRGLVFGAAALGLSASPLGAVARAALGAERRLSFHNLHTGENLSEIYWADGQYIPAATAAIDVVLRDFRTNEVKPIDHRLLDFLHALRLTIDSDRAFHVISGYRSPKTNKMLSDKSNGVAKKSLHMRGMAIDVRLPGTALANLRNAAMSLELGGVGYYAKSDFIHIDIGRVRSW